MTHYTNPNFTTSKFGDFGAEEKRQYATYLWDCAECGQRTCTDATGGVLNPCLKKDRADYRCGNDGHDLFVTVVIGGFADAPRSMASIEGREPGEPSKRKQHEEHCAGEACLDDVHWSEPGFHERREAARRTA